MIIDCYSKYVWTHPLKSKSATDVSAAIENIFKRSKPRLPKNLQTDRGKEFFNAIFKNLMQKYNINHYCTFSVKKAAIVERVIRTLKSILFKRFSLQGTYKWWNILDEVTSEYNHKKHRTIGMKPTDVTSKTKLLVYDNLKISPKPKFTVDDVVRISKFKSQFEKGYTPQWSTELFKICKTNLTNPPTYLLQDFHNKQIQGCFYEPELQKVKYTDIYLVEKILRKKGNNLYVKWLGLDKSHNSWIKNTDVSV